jgi:hypothetical protein
MAKQSRLIRRPQRFSLPSPQWPGHIFRNSRSLPWAGYRISTLSLSLGPGVRLVEHALTAIKGFQGRENNGI